MPDIVTVAEVKEHLNDQAAGEAELQRFVGAATRVVEELCGAVVARDVTEYHDPRGRVIILNEPHVVSVTSVTEGSGATTYALAEDVFGQAGNPYGYRRDGSLLYRTSGGYDGRFTPGHRVRVVYRAGFDPVPDDIKLAALELIRFWWRPSQNGIVGDAGPMGQGSGTVLAAGYLVPYSVQTLLAPYKRGPVVA